MRQRFTLAIPISIYEIFMYIYQYPEIDETVMSMSVMMMTFFNIGRIK